MDRSPAHFSKQSGTRNARLSVRAPSRADQELELEGEVSIGRAFDNAICIDHASISRYHAIIEERADGFWVCDLGGVNGTTVNGEPVRPDRKLQDGDLIAVGEVRAIEFHCDEPRSPGHESSAADSPPLPDELPPQPTEGGSPQVSQDASRSITPVVLIASGAVLALLVVLVLALTGTFSSSADPGAVRIVGVGTGSTVGRPIAIRTDVENPRQVRRVIYQLDGVEFASVLAPPYDVTLDPSQLAAKFPRLRSENHVLSVTLEDREGGKTTHPEKIVLAFEMPGPESADGTTGDSSSETGSTEGTGGEPTVVGTAEVRTLAQGLAGQITGKSGSRYLFDEELTRQIRMRTAEYRLDVITDARRYHREIAKAFSDNGLPLPLGFVMAMSRSRFKGGSITPTGSGEVGLWRMPSRIAQEYLAAGESLSALNDPKRSAEIAAKYMKDLVTAFPAVLDDFMYAVACYGMPIREIAQISSRLQQVAPDPAARGDFWKMVKLGVVPSEGVDRVVRFFAAGIVAENPQRFDLRAQPLSSLY